MPEGGRMTADRTASQANRYRAYANRLREQRLKAVPTPVPLPTAGAVMQLAVDVIRYLRNEAEPRIGRKFPGESLVPMHCHAVDAADELTQKIAYHCAGSGLPTTGHGRFWRYATGPQTRQVRGLLNADPRPVQRLVNTYRLAERDGLIPTEHGNIAARALTSELRSMTQRYSGLTPIIREGLTCI